MALEQNHDPWSKLFIDDTREGFWAIIHENWEGQWMFAGTEEQADMGLTLLRFGGITVPGTLNGLARNNIEDELQYELAPQMCSICEGTFMRCQVHNERCIACQS